MIRVPRRESFWEKGGGSRFGVQGVCGWEGRGLSLRLFTFGVGGGQGAGVHELPLRDNQRFAQAPISGRFLRGNGKNAGSYPEAGWSGGWDWGPGATRAGKP